jgi:hypothetical protein
MMECAHTERNYTGEARFLPDANKTIVYWQVCSVCGERFATCKSPTGCAHVNREPSRVEIRKGPCGKELPYTIWQCSDCGGEFTTTQLLNK